MSGEQWAYTYNNHSLVYKHLLYINSMFVDQSKLDQKCQEHLMVNQEGGVKIFGYDEVVAHVNDIISQNTSGKIWVSIYPIV